MVQQKDIQIFYSYSHKDEIFREQLEEHLAIFRRAGLIRGWSDRKITPGAEWKAEIDKNIESADLILILISASFIASDYCIEKELAVAIQRHEAGLARVIPIFVRPTSWQDAPFAGIQGLPKDAIPVTKWGNQDEAWQNIADGIRSVLEEIQEQKKRPVSNTYIKTLQEAMTLDVESIDRLYSPESAGIEGLTTGFRDLDRVTNGLHPGELFVLAARPTQGKTSLALNMAVSVATNDLPVLIFSTKLAARDVSRRIITATAHVNYWAISTARIQDDDWPRLVFAIQKLNDLSILIDDSASISLIELRERCLNEKKKLGGLGLVVIDPIQYIQYESETKNVENVGRFLKSLARELNTTILVISEVSRIVETRPNKRPVPNDIKNASGLVDEADVVAFIYMDSHYNPDSPDTGTAEILIAKNQYGPLHTVVLVHNNQYGTFQNYSLPTNI